MELDDLSLAEASDECLSILARAQGVDLVGYERDRDTVKRRLCKSGTEEQLIKRYRTLIAADVAITRERAEQRADERSLVHQWNLDACRDALVLLRSCHARLLVFGCWNIADDCHAHIRIDVSVLRVARTFVRIRIVIPQHRDIEANEFTYKCYDETWLYPTNTDAWCYRFSCNLFLSAGQCVSAWSAQLTQHLPLLPDLVDVVKSYVGVELECYEGHAQLRVE